MSLKVDEINRVIEKVEKQIVSYNSSIELICLIHKTGTRKNECAKLKKGYMEEEVSSSINKLLYSWMKDDQTDTSSEFLGTIETHKSTLGGLIKKQLFLNIIAINVDNYSTETELEVDLYRLCWNICNAIKNAANQKKKDSKDRILIPSPKGLRKLGNNLQADIFGALNYSLQNKEDFIKPLGVKRAQAVVSKKHTFKPEDFPFIMTLDQTQYLYTQLLNKRKLTSNSIEQVWAASKVIIQTMNQQKLAIWEKFATYTQDMAWRGFSPEVILSIAIDHNDDIETKKLGVQVVDLINVKPISADESSGYYNPFKTDSENIEMHNTFIEELFENLLTRAIFENSATPFKEKAREQDLKLQKGQFMGWCAAALYDAADVFEKSIKAKQPPTQTTREIFKAGLNKVTLIKLKTLGEEILNIKKEKVDFKERDFIDFLNADYRHKAVADSVIRSMRKNDISEDSGNYLSKTESISDDEIYGPGKSYKELEETVHH